MFQEVPSLIDTYLEIVTIIFFIVLLLPRDIKCLARGESLKCIYPIEIQVKQSAFSLFSSILLTLLNIYRACLSALQFRCLYG